MDYHTHVGGVEGIFVPTTACRKITIASDIHIFTPKVMKNTLGRPNERS